MGVTVEVGKPVKKLTDHGSLYYGTSSAEVVKVVPSKTLCHTDS